jgi:hypothetical protein
MMIVIEAYPYLDIERAASAHFVWFMSAADVGVLTADFAMTHVPKLGRALLDTAIVLSQNAGAAGRIGLHAAAAGGVPLVQLYEQCGLTRLPKGAGLPPAVRRNNDGRFFYTDEIQAETLASLLDPDR